MPAHRFIRSDFSHGLEGKLIAQVSRKLREDDVYVSPFQRFGFSGARLFLIYFNRNREGVPHLLKVTTLDKAKDERNATKKMGRFVQDAVLPTYSEFKAEDQSGEWHGALLYFHRGADSPQGAGEPKVLRELIYDRGISLTKLRKLIDGVFQKLDGAHSRFVPKDVVLEHHFKRYLRKHLAKGRSQSRVRRILAPTADARELMLLGARIYNPVKFVSILSKRVKLMVAPVHGDLHPDNIVIDRDDVPHLIDFAWADKKRDVLVDFVLLENSIRFMAFPRPINLTDQLKVDRALVHEKGFEQIASLKLCSDEHRDDYARLACAVGVIRKRARALLKEKFSMKQYLLTQFILLYGLMCYESYEPYASARALGLIAARLRKIGLPS